MKKKKKKKKKKMMMMMMMVIGKAIQSSLYEKPHLRVLRFFRVLLRERRSEGIRT